MKKRILLSLLPLALLADDQLKVYHIGNSLTASLTLDRVHRLFEQMEIDYQFGAQLSGGKSLIRHMNYKQEPGQKWINWETNQAVEGGFEPDPNPYHGEENIRFGYYEEALSNHKWDTVVMQLYGSSLHDDVQAISHFTEICLKNKTCNNFYIYSTWPRRDKEKQPDGSIRIKDIDYPSAWKRPYEFDVTSTEKGASRNTPTREYTEKVYSEMRTRLPESVSLQIIPAGEVLFQLDQKIKAGEIPGLQALAERNPALVPGWENGADLSRGINLLYADAIHLNPIPHKEGTLGIFVSGTTVFTALSGKNPQGMSAADYGLDDTLDAALIRAVQTVIRDTVRSQAEALANP